MNWTKRNIIWLSVAGTLFALTVLYHVNVAVWGNAPPLALEIGLQLVVFAYLAIICKIILTSLKDKRLGSLRVLWVLLLMGFAVFTLSGVFSVEFNKGAIQLKEAIAIRTVWDVLLVSFTGLLQGAFGCLVIILLRELVLFKRSRSSLRNWYVMLVLMLAALFVATVEKNLEPFLSVGVLPLLSLIATLLAMGAMVVNSFRLSWVAYLSMKEKLAALVIALLLLTVLVFAFLEVSLTAFWNNSSPFIHIYSPALPFLLLLSLIFGILYCTTAFLSLMFHLPTSSDFQKRADDLAAMHSLTKLVSQVFDTQKLVSTITESAVENPKSQTAWLALTDLRSGTLKPQIVSSFNVTQQRIDDWMDLESLYGEVYNAHSPLLLNHATTDHRIKARPGDGVGSLLAVPLKNRNEAIGALFVTKDVANGFESDDIESLETFADQASLALENARLFESRIEKERLSRELGIAREVQLKLLPQHLPRLSGLSIAASSVFAQEVGGDYYDFVALDEDRLSLIIGDVSGKGTSAAFFMAELKGIYQALSRAYSSPAELLRKANEAISVSKDKNIFISAICGVIDRKTETFLVSRAGHCPIAMIDLHGNAQYLRKGGLGLGLAKDSTFRDALVEERIKLEPGDVYILYTDGLIESRDQEGDTYGYDRLVDILKSYRHESSESIHQRILTDLHEFIGHSRYFDDLTLVVLKWHGVGSNFVEAAISLEETTASQPSDA